MQDYGSERDRRRRLQAQRWTAYGNRLDLIIEKVNALIIVHNADKYNVQQQVTYNLLLFVFFSKVELRLNFNFDDR